MTELFFYFVKIFYQITMICTKNSQFYNYLIINMLENRSFVCPYKDFFIQSLQIL